MVRYVCTLIKPTVPNISIAQPIPRLRRINPSGKIAAILQMEAIEPGPQRSQKPNEGGQPRRRLSIWQSETRAVTQKGCEGCHLSLR